MLRKLLFSSCCMLALVPLAFCFGDEWEHVSDEESKVTIGTGCVTHYLTFCHGINDECPLGLLVEYHIDLDPGGEPPVVSHGEPQMVNTPCGGTGFEMCNYFPNDPCMGL